MEEEEHSKATNWVLIYFAAGIVIIAGIMALWDMVLRLWFGFDYEKRASFGDEFGPLGVILSGAALFGLILSILLQRKDLRAQTRTLELQQKALLQQIEEFAEQKEELRRSAAAQEAANKMASAQLEMQALTQELQFSLAFVQANASRGFNTSEMTIDRCNGLIERMKELAADHRHSSPYPYEDRLDSDLEPVAVN